MNKNKIVFEWAIFSSFILWVVFTTKIAIDHQFKVPYVEPSHFEQWVSEHSPVIIDLRESEEIERFPLTYQPVIHLPFLSIEGKLDQIQIPRDCPVLFVCSDENRARLVASLLFEKDIRTYYLRSGLESTHLYSKRVETKK
ncbi:MAG TPA: rhodanese-like domain-containing protein [Caldithrix sp.]|nr:rhodanese-like domain-containing protein [Caldithrix sp.]